MPNPKKAIKNIKIPKAPASLNQTASTPMIHSIRKNKGLYLGKNLSKSKIKEIEERVLTEKTKFTTSYKNSFA